MGPPEVKVKGERQWRTLLGLAVFDDEAHSVFRTEANRQNGEHWGDPGIVD